MTLCICVAETVKYAGHLSIPVCGWTDGLAVSALGLVCARQVGAIECQFRPSWELGADFR